MANIGSFKKVGLEYQGEIVTLSVQAKNVRIVAEENRSDTAPTHRVFVGRAEIGAAWAKRSNEGRPYLGQSSSTIRASPRPSSRTSSTRKGLIPSRYFGPLPASAVIGRAVPVWTNEE